VPGVSVVHSFRSLVHSDADCGVKKHQPVSDRTTVQNEGAGTRVRERVRKRVPGVSVVHSFRSLVHSDTPRSRMPPQLVPKPTRERKQTRAEQTISGKVGP